MKLWWRVVWRVPVNWCSCSRELTNCDRPSPWASPADTLEGLHQGALTCTRGSAWPLGSPCLALRFRFCLLRVRCHLPPRHELETPVFNHADGAENCTTPVLVSTALCTRAPLPLLPTAFHCYRVTIDLGVRRFQSHQVQAAL